MSDPAPPALTALNEADRAEAHRRCLILRAHLEDGVALSQVAAETLEQAEIEATLAGHREWVAAGRPGAVSHEEAMAALIGCGQQ